MSTNYSSVFEPIRIRGVQFKNRLELAPPSPNLASSDWKVTKEFVDFFRPFAKGGVGIIHVGNSIIDIREACDEERQLDLGTDDCILPLTRFVEMCQGYGCQPSLEINHSGKDSQFEKTGRRACSASSFIPSREVYNARNHNREPMYTVEMDKGMIRETVEKYAMAAYRCKRAGFKMCMLHGGHGNLISQFSSPLYNCRTDEYGGSLENRTRFTIEVLDRIRELCGEDFVIEFRVSADEIHPDGMHYEETLKYIELFKDKIDILHVSAGLHGEFEYMRNWWQNWMMDRQYNVHYAEKIKKAFPGLLVATVGSIMNIKSADEIIETGKADFVAMCRPLLADPEMPRKYALGREDDHRPCLRCQYCGGRLLIPAVINCAVNPYLGEEADYPAARVPKAEVKKKVAVIGGGPAGVTALLTLIERGHDVTLYEKSDQIGGNVIPAAAAPFKIDMKDYLDYLQRQVKKAPARILMNTEATKEMLNQEKYDALVVAVGASPIIPRLPGVDKPHVHWAADADMGKVEVGKKVVIVGAGAVGVECAITLGREGHEVEIVEMLPNMMGLMASASGAMRELMDALDALKIPVHLSTRLEEVTDDGVVCSNLETNEKATYKADTVLLALGMKPKFDVADALRRSAPETEVYVVGDAIEAKTIGPAVKSGFKAAAAI